MTVAVHVFVGPSHDQVVCDVFSLLSFPSEREVTIILRRVISRHMVGFLTYGTLTKHILATK